MVGVTIVGAQWGDEGKGAVVCKYAEEADIVARFAGGDNAGHTLYDRLGNKRATNIAPSGILFPKVINVIGNGCVVNLETLVRNIEGLNPILLISDAAHLILDWHIKLDGAKEKARGKNALGTTKRGIGPCYADKANRIGIRAGLMKFPQRLEKAILEVSLQKNIELQMYGLPGVNPSEMYYRLKPLFEKFAPMVTDTSLYLNQTLKENKKILFEGAQAVMLDIDHGTYPFCTSSSTTIGGVLTGLGIGARAVNHIIGVAKAYTTRVGEGIFPTEGEDYEKIKNENRGKVKLTASEKDILKRGSTLHPEYDQIASKKLRIVGDEFGTTTGRPRRTGWLDLVILKKAARINGLDSFAITKLDCLDGIQILKVCFAYQNPKTGKRLYEFPNDQEELRGFKPIYRHLLGWENTKGIKSYSKLPPTAQEYIKFISNFTGIPVSLIKNGPKQDECIELLSPW